MMMPPSQGVPPQNTEWNGYQYFIHHLPKYRAPMYLGERSMPAPPPYVINNSGTETNVHKQYPLPNQLMNSQNDLDNLFAVSSFKNGGFDKGLPLRPDQNICTHYSRYGICKFGPACKFDHPLHLTSSTTSGLDHQLPFSDLANIKEAGIARSRSGTDDTIQL
ncbi:hypothetical protein M0R45_023947 [Rubus argutus]|uniref:C3H1-type domain-containing protein n=1 Tax=Rubus argutus TaxID=59490 RepID=A0AAW1WRN4_RUBAR